MHHFLLTFDIKVIFILIEQCDWYCDYNEDDESYKCLQETDLCDGTPTCDDGTDEDYCDESVSFTPLSSNSLLAIIGKIGVNVVALVNRF